jgi:hypothetical protein
MSKKPRLTQSFLLHQLLIAIGLTFLPSRTNPREHRLKIRSISWAYLLTQLDSWVSTICSARCANVSYRSVGATGTELDPSDVSRMMSLS